MAEKVEAVARNTAQLSESPHWDDSTQCLFYVDAFKGNVHRYNTLTGEDSCKSVSDTVCTVMIPRQQGGFVVATGTDIGLLDSLDSDVVETLSNVETAPVLLNNGKVDALGRLWIGSNFFGDGDPSQWPQGQGHLYSVNADHTVHKHIGNINISNGMAWSNDNRTMYYIDSIPGCIMAFDFDLNTGNIGNKRTVTDFGPKDNRDLNIPDGMTIDIEGKLWVAGYDDGKIIRVDPATGKVIRTVNFPVKRITSCCFGGKDFANLYVTTSAFHMTPDELTQSPLAGSVFRVSGLGVKGRKANIFAG